MDSKVWMYMPLSIIALTLIWLLASRVPVFGEPLALEYIEGEAYRRASEGSSLPSRFNERVVEDAPATASLMRRTNAPALFAVFPAPYETIRDRLVPSVRQTLGQDRFFEEKHDDLVEWNEWYGQGTDPGGFHQKWREENERKLRDAGIHWQAYQETRIVSKTYNSVWWKRGWSQAMFRIIDGRDLFDLACTIVLFTRTDYELRFGFLHNTPMPAIFVGSDPLVTDREVSLIEKVKDELGIPVTFFVAGVMSLLDNVTPLIETKDHCVNTSPPSSR